MATYPETDQELFAGSNAKLMRARQFISELADEAARYRSSNPISVVMENGSLRIDYKAITLKPSVIVGDALHNMRAALDLMACELARLNGESDKGVFFPFSETEADFDKILKDKKFHRAGPDAVDLVKSLKPYPRGNSMLRALHDLDVQDKHRAIGIAGSNMTVSVRGLYRIDDPTQGQFEADLSSFHYLFADGPFSQRPVLDTLEDLVKLAEGILKSFAGLVAARP